MSKLLPSNVDVSVTQHSTSVSSAQSLKTALSQNWKTVAKIVIPVIVASAAVGIWINRRQRKKRAELHRKKLARQVLSESTSTTPTKKNNKTEINSPSTTKPTTPIKLRTPDKIDSSVKNVTAMPGKMENKELSSRPSIDLNDASVTLDSARSLAQAAKARGNKLYSNQKYEQAITCYTEAIETSPPNDPEGAVFYSNRAACYACLHQFDQVIEDCNQALKLDGKYVKAMLRRAHALENLNLLDEALTDYTAAYILDGMQNETAMLAADRLLKTIGKEKATERMKTRRIQMPSRSFISAYLSSFSYNLADESTISSPTSYAEAVKDIDDDTNKSETIKDKKKDIKITEGDRAYAQAVTLARKQNHDAALKEFTKAIEKHATQYSRALNWRGTFYYLQGELDRALADFNTSFKESNLADINDRVNVLIKRGSVLMEKGDKQRALDDFSTAIKLNPLHPDIYYHRGQVYMLGNELDSAITDYEKAIKLDSKLIFAHIQLGVAQYKTGNVTLAFKTFENALEQFAETPFVHNYFGELLMDQQRFDEAAEQFDQAIRLDSKCPLPYINKALLLFQGRNDLNGAMTLCEQAIKYDDRCDVAYAHLAQMQLHQGNIQAAIVNFDKAIDLSRTDVEMANVFACREAAAAQLNVLNKMVAAQVVE